MLPLLYRRLLAEGTPNTIKTLERCHVIDGEGALGRVMQEGYQLLGQLPAFTPPFEAIWIELGKMDTGNLGPAYYAGVGIRTTDVRERDLPKAVQEAMDKYGKSIGWTLEMTIIVDTLPPNIGEWMARFNMMLTSEGGLIAVLNDQNETGFDLGDLVLNAKLLESARSEDMRKDLEEGARAIAVECVTASLMVLGMLHCKNVKLEEQKPSAKTLKKRLKHGKPTEERFYTIKVTGKGARAGQSALRVPSGARNAMHWCRGHFRKYSEEAPLFGRIVGTFWVDPHLRGDKGSGNVRKAYQVDVTQPIPHGAEV